MNFRRFLGRYSRRTSIIVAGMLLTMLMTSGCGSSGESLVNPVDSGGGILIEVSRSEQPKINWADGNPIQAISVMGFDTQGHVDQILWGYVNSAISPPVKYGDPIEGGVSLTGSTTAPPLASGQRYRVEVVRDEQASYTDWIMP